MSKGLKSISFVIILGILLVCLINATVTRAYKIYSWEMEQKGKAVSYFMEQHYGLEYPPEHAKYYQAVITTTDVSFSGAHINNFWEEEEYRKKKWGKE